MISLLFAVPLFPLAAAIIVAVVGDKLPDKGATPTLAASALSLGILFTLYGETADHSIIWLEAGIYSLSVGLELTPLTWFVATLIAAVSVPVTLYAVGYMGDAPGRPRFFSALSLFGGAMLTLVLADTLLLLFIAWEAIGVAAFFLIGFHTEDQRARAAASKAFLMTRVGDFGLLVGWLLLWQATGTVDIGEILRAASDGTIAPTTMMLSAILILVAAIGRSAQLPLSSWLPDAMVAPTPVSALLHSTTLGAAGVYLILRLFDLFAAVPVVLWLLVVVGGATALFAALVATADTDLKRILAWSTISQLGEMMLVLGLGGRFAATFYLATHVAFKSTLFLAAGAVDERTGTRTIRRLGGLARTMPITASVFTLGALALAGLPPFSGYWSEEMVLANAVEAGSFAATLVLVLMFLAGVYISRAGMTVFAGTGTALSARTEDPTGTMVVGMIVLGIAAVGFGWILSETLADILPFREPGEIAVAWSTATLVASVTGLAYGAWHATSRGIAPALGPMPLHLAQRLDEATETPVEMSKGIAESVQRLEGSLDHGARTLAESLRGAAEPIGSVETVLDGLIRAPAHAAATTVAGGRTARLGTDRLSFYMLGVAAWVLIVTTAGLFLMWLRA